MTITITDEQAIDILGAKLWEKNGYRRFYLNNWTELAGVEISYYKSGNISSATLGGELISNSKAYKLGLAGGKVWIENGQVRTQYLAEPVVDLLHEAIAAKLAPVAIQVTTREAAERLGVSVRTVQRWAKLGKIAAIKTDNRWTITL